jgi:vacuolar-type H+-ATPase subunit E/Vma4
MAKLEEILQAEVEAEINAIINEADAEVADIVSEAENRAKGRLAAHRKRSALQFDRRKVRRNSAWQKRACRPKGR